MRVSAVIPVYNQAQYLGQAIGSVLAQTYPVHEIIVVNDGSTDETEVVARSFGGLIRYVTQENRGPAAARNAAMRIASGDAIALLDADDIWQPDKLRRQAEVLSQRPDVGVVHTSFYRMGERGEYLYSVHDPARLPDPPLPALLLHNYVCGASVMFRRDCIERVGFQNEALRSGFMDWDFSIRIALAGYRFVCIDEPLYGYRLHASQITLNPHRNGPRLEYLTRLFDSPWLPAELRSVKDAALFGAHVQAAADFYRADLVEQARHHLALALTLRAGETAWASDIILQIAPGGQFHGRRMSLCETARAVAFVEEAASDFAWNNPAEARRSLGRLRAFARLAQARACLPGQPFAALRYLVAATRWAPGIWGERSVWDRVRLGLRRSLAPGSRAGGRAAGGSAT